MEGAQVTLSHHATHRSAQRNISHDDIQFIIRNGYRLHNAGVIFCQLRNKDIPSDTPGNHRCHKLVGTTLVLCKCGHYVITMYREEKAFRNDRRKNKYCIETQSCICPSCGHDQQNTISKRCLRSNRFRH